MIVGLVSPSSAKKSNGEVYPGQRSRVVFSLTPAQNGTLSGTPIFDFETFLKSSKINNSNSNFKTIFFNKLLSWCILKFSFMYHSNVKLINLKNDLPFIALCSD